jgi:hypothetical protein
MTRAIRSGSHPSLESYSISATEDRVRGCSALREAINGLMAALVEVEDYIRNLVLDPNREADAHRAKNAARAERFCYAPIQVRNHQCTCL